MTYSSSDYEKATAELEKRRLNAQQAQKKRHDEAAAKCPALLSAEREMAAAGLAVIKALGMGDDAEKYVSQLRNANLEAQRKRAQLLKENGYPADYLEIKYTCPVCEDKGFVNGKMCMCQKKILRSLAYNRLCSKFPLDKCTFNNFDLKYYPDNGDDITPYQRMETVLDFCKNYADDFSHNSPSLLMYGETGLGKTHLSLAIAGTVIKNGGGVIYASAQNILNKLEDEKFGRSENENTLNSLIECDLLILDDLGAEFSTQFTVSAIYNIVNSRLLGGKPTIISTNLSMKQLETVYTKRTASRILSEYTLLRFDGSDIRQLKTAADF